VNPAWARSAPWSLAGVVAIYVTTGLGLALVAASWWGTSGTVVVHDELPWLQVGIVGLVVLGTGNGVWLLAGRRAVGQRRRLLVADVDVDSLPRPGVAVTAEHPLPVAATGMRRFHRPECPLALGKPVVAATPDEHLEAGRAPCGICRP